MVKGIFIAAALLVIYLQFFYHDEASYSDEIAKQHQQVSYQQKEVNTAPEKHNLSNLKKPFYNPVQYLYMDVVNASILAGKEINKLGKISSEDGNANILIESTDGIVTFVEIDLKQTQPCSMKNDFDHNPILVAAGINPDELSIVQTRTDLHKFYDHKRKLKVVVACSVDGGPNGY